MKQVLSCRVNGREIEALVDPRASLTDFLRNDLHLTSVKKGCEVGECRLFMRLEMEICMQRKPQLH